MCTMRVCDTRSADTLITLISHNSSRYEPQNIGFKGFKYRKLVNLSKNFTRAVQVSHWDKFRIVLYIYLFGLVARARTRYRSEIKAEARYNFISISFAPSLWASARLMGSNSSSLSLACDARGEQIKTLRATFHSPCIVPRRASQIM